MLTQQPTKQSRKRGCVQPKPNNMQARAQTSNRVENSWQQQCAAKRQTTSKSQAANKRFQSKKRARKPATSQATKRSASKREDKLHAQPTSKQRPFRKQAATVNHSPSKVPSRSKQKPFRNDHVVEHSFTNNQHTETRRYTKPSKRAAACKRGHGAPDVAMAQLTFTN